MVIDKDMKSLQRILDKKAAKDKDIHECWESNKAEGLSRIAFCLRYGKRFSSLIESLEKSLSVYKRHGTIEELGLDDHSADKHLDNQTKQTPKNDFALDNGISFPF